MMISFDLENFINCSLTAVLSFILTTALMPSFIRLIVRLRMGQEVRELGPEAHLKKQGTPTMGGAVFLLAALISTACGMLRMGAVQKETLQILFLTAGFGFTGFMDDYLKITRHNSDGLMPRQKLSIQLVLSLILVIWVYAAADEEGGLGHILIPMSGNFESAYILKLPLVIFALFAVFVILGTDNGVNFTDGLDGLCSSVTMVVAAMFVMVGLVNAKPGVALPAAALLGGLMGFLLFNAYPAKVFMGDTGSLALGGFVAASAVSGGMELYVPIFGFIYMIEVLSVIIQVTYFKKTGGKRFFRMSPIHHHFELLGHSETRIVAAFTIVTALMCILSFIGVSYVR